MNVSDAACRVGENIKKSDLGREHSTIWKQLMVELSDSAQSQISEILSKHLFVGFGNHFYSFLILNDILEGNKDNKYFEKDIKEIFLNANYHRLLKVSKKLGDELEETLMNIYKIKNDIKFFGTGKEEVPKLRRALVDLQRQIQRTGFVEWSLVNLQNQSLLSEYEKKRERVPFSKKNSQIRKSTALNNEELEKLNNIEKIIMMMDYIKEVIFNAHMDNFIEINLIKVNKFRFMNSDNLKLGILILNDELIFKKSFFIKVREGYKINYGLAKNINMHFDNRGEHPTVTTKMKVYLLPENDTDIFR